MGTAAVVLVYDEYDMVSILKCCMMGMARMVVVSVPHSGEVKFNPREFVYRYTSGAACSMSTRPHGTLYLQQYLCASSSFQLIHRNYSRTSIFGTFFAGEQVKPLGSANMTNMRLLLAVLFPALLFGVVNGK